MHDLGVAARALDRGSGHVAVVQELHVREAVELVLLVVATDAAFLGRVTAPRHDVGVTALTGDAPRDHLPVIEPRAGDLASRCLVTRRAAAARRELPIPPGALHVAGEADGRRNFEVPVDHDLRMARSAAQRLTGPAGIEVTRVIEADGARERLRRSRAESIPGVTPGAQAA